MEQILKANKDHLCDACGLPIEKGNQYKLVKLRLPKMEATREHLDPDDEGKQVGIEFFKQKYHNYDCTAPDNCKAGLHNFVYDTGYWGGERICSAGWYCTECSKWSETDPNIN